jgi:NADH:ubiquinone oxidoreductase subunit D
VKFTVPVYAEGDVNTAGAIDEVGQSLEIIRQLLPHLPPGPLKTSVVELPSAPRSASSNWRGGFSTGFAQRPATGWRAAKSKTLRCKTGPR